MGNIFWVGVVIFLAVIVIVPIGCVAIQLLVTWLTPGETIKETMAHAMWEKVSGKLTSFEGRRCRCGKGRMRPDGRLVWDEGSKYRFVERFYKCTACGRVLSNQYPEEW
jgi:hypothetical protein